MPKRTKTTRQKRIEDKVQEEERKRLVNAALEAAADKLNREKSENGGRVPYGAMPTAIACLALLNIKATSKKLIRLMEKRADVSLVVSVEKHQASLSLVVEELKTQRILMKMKCQLTPGKWVELKGLQMQIEDYTIKIY